MYEILERKTANHGEKNPSTSQLFHVPILEDVKSFIKWIHIYQVSYIISKGFLQRGEKIAMIFIYQLS